MATAIDSAFREFKTNLEITGLQSSTVSSRQQNVRDAVVKELSVSETFLTGSYSRNTMIAPLARADVDIFLVLDNQYYYHYDGQNGGQGGLLDLLKRVLRRTYPTTPDISRNGQAVSISFSDFIVDVVPAFNRQGGGYVIPNSIMQTWISTNPKRHVEIWTDENKAHDGTLVPLIKMIKGWNKTIGDYFVSFHLEAMVLHLLQRVKITDYPSGVRYFFDKGRTYVTQKNPDPASYSSDLGAYLNTRQRIDEAANKMSTAYERAFKAESLGHSYKIPEAIDVWRRVFGSYFPSYG